MHIAILGLGAMGARMADRLLAAGHDLTVWNRSPGPTDAFSDRATVADTPAAAARGADVVLSMVTDDDASRAVWTGADGALSGLGSDAVAIESSTLTPDWVRELADAVADTGAAFLDAPVSGSRPQAEAGALIFLVGGASESVERVRPLMEAMGGAVHHVGPAGQGAAMKLAVNGLYAIQVAAVGEWFHTLAASGVEPERAVEVLSATPVTSPAAVGALKATLAQAFDPLFPIDLVEKDLRYGAAFARSVGVEPSATERARETFARAQAEGLGGKNITAVSQVFEPSPTD